MFHARGCPAWEVGPGPTAAEEPPRASIAIAAPEDLHVLDKAAQAGTLLPEFIHVVDPSGMLPSQSRGPRRRGASRQSTVAKYGATCTAAGSRPYVTLWTLCNPMSRSPSALGKAAGVEAWQYADGRTIRMGPVAKACA